MVNVPSAPYICFYTLFFRQSWNWQMTILEAKFIFRPCFPLPWLWEEEYFLIYICIHRHSIFCRCSIHFVNKYVFIYAYILYIYIPKIQCNLLVGFKRKGVMPWAKTDRLWRSCCPLQPNNPGCDTGVFWPVSPGERPVDSIGMAKERPCTQLFTN